MIKVGDIVVLKEENDINFKSYEDRLRYLSHRINRNNISLNKEYKITMRLTEISKYTNRLFYNVTFFNDNNVQNLYPMTWFRKAESHKRITRNRNIDNILND